MKKMTGSGATLLATSVLLLGVVAQAGPPPGQTAVHVEVGTVLASNQLKRIDQRLAGQGMQARLTRLFQYRSYELVSQETREVQLGHPFRFVLPAGLELRVQAERIAASGQVELRVELMEKEVMMVDTALTLGQQGRVVLGGRNHLGGVLLVWVGARAGDPFVLPPAVAPPQRAGQVPARQDLLPATAVAK